MTRGEPLEASRHLVTLSLIIIITMTFSLYRVALAAELIEFLVNTAPWRTSDTFISSVRNKTTVMQVASGPGNPSGRPHCYSFTRRLALSLDPEEQDPDEKAHKAPQVGTITGTDNDLRRLLTVEMKSILLAWGVEPSQIPTNRWRLVDLIRQVIHDPCSYLLLAERLSIMSYLISSLTLTLTLILTHLLHYTQALRPTCNP